MIKFVVCEDNNEVLENVGQYIVKTMMNYDIEYKIIKFNRYDNKFKKVINDDLDTKIYILDVELPGVSGLEIASEIREVDDDSKIIFVTAHSECKNDIFYSRLGVIDFISKFQHYEKRLCETIEYIINKIYRENVLSFTSNYSKVKLRYREINYIEKVSTQNRCIIHEINGNEKYITASIIRLKDILEPLFIQSHKSCLVNKDNIKEVDFSKGVIYFKNGDSTDLVTVAGRKVLREFVGDF